MSGFSIIQPGLLSLIQDRGRFGMHNIGLTTGGPLDRLAFGWANRLIGNDANASGIEVSFGGLSIESNTDSSFVITGAEAPCRLNSTPIEQWRTHSIAPGDKLEIGYTVAGTRCYLAVNGGFHIEPSFGSSATVIREKTGGLRGIRLEAGDHLPCASGKINSHYQLAEKYRPLYSNSATLRVVSGYQQASFDRLQHWRFFNSKYQLTERCDRMGFRLEGETIHCDISAMLSEGICLGAIQIPADGQPIVLMNDRQTIGGYPKIGSVIAADLGSLAQMSPGSTVRFESIGIEQADNIHWLEKSRFERIQPEAC